MKKGLGRAEARSSDLASRFSMTLFGVLPAPTGISMREAVKKPLKLDIMKVKLFSRLILPSALEQQ